MGTLLRVENVSAALPGLAPSEIVHLTTGTSSVLFKSLSATDKEKVVIQVTDSIRHVFMYLTATSSLGFVLAFLLSVRHDPHQWRPSS